MNDRRVLFFAGAAVVSALLVPAAPRDFRWVCWVVAVTYIVLAVASALDSYSRSHTARAPHPSFRRSVPEDPFE